MIECVQLSKGMVVHNDASAKRNMRCDGKVSRSWTKRRLCVALHS